MTTQEADKIVLEQLLAQAAGVRMRAANPLVGTRAGVLEQELSERLAKVNEALERRQGALKLEEAA